MRITLLGAFGPAAGSEAGIAAGQTLGVGRAPGSAALAVPGDEHLSDLQFSIESLDRLRAFHGNDSKRPCGSRVDRHEHIGAGCLGLAPFHRLLHDRQFAGLPLMIETEKSTDGGRTRDLVADPLDVKNLDTLRRLRDDPAKFACQASA